MSVLLAFALLTAEPAPEDRAERGEARRDARTVTLDDGFFRGPLAGGVERPRRLILVTGGARAIVLRDDQTRATRPEQPFSIRSSAASKSLSSP
ncbi:MAG: hypothetical protein ACOC0V_00430 [Oceanicaulis sp.]